MKPKRRYITDNTMDAIIHWIFASCPCVLEDKGFVRGLFVITDDAIAEAVRAAIERERRRSLKALRKPCAQ